MAEFKVNDIKKVGIVRLSPERLTHLASKLKSLLNEDKECEIETYLIPTDIENVSDLAFDFGKIKVSEPVLEAPVEEVTPTVDPVNEVPEVDPANVPKVAPVVDPSQQPAVEQVTTVAPVVDPITTPVAEEVTPTVEVVKTEPVVNPEGEVAKKTDLPLSESVGLSEEELTAKAKEITDKMNTNLNSK